MCMGMVLAPRSRIDFGPIAASQTPHEATHLVLVWATRAANIGRHCWYTPGISGESAGQVGSRVLGRLKRLHLLLLERLRQPVPLRRGQGVHGGGIAPRRVLGSVSYLVGIHLQSRQYFWYSSRSSFVSVNFVHGDRFSSTILSWANISVTGLVVIKQCGLVPDCC